MHAAETTGTTHEHEDDDAAVELVTAHEEEPVYGPTGYISSDDEAAIQDGIDGVRI